LGVFPETGESAQSGHSELPPLPHSRHPLQVSQKSPQYSQQHAPHLRPTPQQSTQAYPQVRHEPHESHKSQKAPVDSPIPPQFGQFAAADAVSNVNVIRAKTISSAVHTIKNPFKELPDNKAFHLINFIRYPPKQFSIHSFPCSQVKLAQGKGLRNNRLGVEKGAENGKVSTRKELKL
jgi:hypothetical protein